MKKNELRIKYKALRKQFTFDEIEEKSLAIANQTLRLPIWDYTNYHIFLPIEAQKEVNTEYLLHIIQGKDKNVILSQSDFTDCSMKHFLLDDQILIKKNSLGIPEPKNGIPIADEWIDVVFVPLLAYDISGHRVGYGKGFYDRFLSKCKPDVVTIGLSFFDAENEIEDASPLDYRLHYVVTPHSVIKIK